MPDSRDKARRYLVTVAGDPAPGEPLDTHLAVLGWNARMEAWLHGAAVCGESVRQGEQDTGTTVTCAKCVEWRPRYEQILANDPAGLLKPYTAVLRQLPREAATELVALLMRDPQVPSRGAIAQAAVLVSAGNRLGWVAQGAEPPNPAGDGGR